MKLLLMGVIGKPHGLHGGCFVRPFNPDSPLWRVGVSFELLPAERVPDPSADTVDSPGARSITFEAVGLGPKGRLLGMFRGVHGREAVEALRGSYLAVPLDALPAPADGEFFFHEVKGWEVVDTAGLALGTVRRVVETYADLLEVRPAKGGAPVLVPIVAAIVTEIDRGARRIVVDPPEGMFP